MLAIGTVVESRRNQMRFAVAEHEKGSARFWSITHQCMLNGLYPEARIAAMLEEGSIKVIEGVTFDVVEEEVRIAAERNERLKAQARVREEADVAGGKLADALVKVKR